MHIHHFCHIVSSQSYVTSQTTAGTYVSLICTCWRAEFRDCFAPCPDLPTSASSVTHSSCSLLKCWSVASTRPFSTVCSWNQRLITVAFQYCKCWPCQVNLPRLARGPHSHLGEWKIQAVPGKSHGHGAMIKRRVRRNHTWNTHQQWIKSKEPRHS